MGAGCRIRSGKDRLVRSSGRGGRNTPSSLHIGIEMNSVDSLIDPPDWANNPPTNDTVTLEQILYIRQVLLIASSDVQFAHKAAKAITISLTNKIDPRLIE